MKRALIWMAANFSMTACAVYGLFYGVQWAVNLTLFAVWLSAVTNTAVAFNNELKQKIAERGRSVPKWLSVCNDIAIVVSLVCAGRFISAVAMFWGMLAELAIFGDTEGVNHG